MLKRLGRIKRLRTELGVAFFLCLTGIVLCLDLFLHQGRPITFDGPTHLTTIAQFGRGLKERQFPVTWADNFATFGLPIPIIAQQTTSYLGGFFWLFTENPILSYNLVVLIAVITSVYLTYLFLKSLVSLEAAAIGSLLFMFAPYRIANIYIRGALPELFAEIFIPIILLGIVRFLRDDQIKGLSYFLIGLSFLILTHPLMLLPTALMAGPFSLYYLIRNHQKWIVKTTLLGAATVIAFATSAYYLMPLLLEIKYFYYGIASTHFNENHFFSWKNYLQPQWRYFAADAVGPRQQYLTVGSLEVSILLVAVLFAVFMWWTHRRSTRLSLLVLLLSITAGLILLTFPITRILYLKTSIFNNLQHPWRLLTIIIYLPPVVLALLSEWLPKKSLSLVMITLLLFLIPTRFTQLYGKNYLVLPLSSYSSSRNNLHGTYLNTIWSSEITDYEPKTDQVELIEGQGIITQLKIQNGTRSYQVNSSTPTRIIDYTFYFPGWKILVDNQPATIEFQDINYRGLMIFDVPAGQHTITESFSDTKIRLVGKVVSIFALIAAGVFCYLILKLPRKLYAHV